MSAAAGWYADPSGVPGQLRWWDGARWTDHVTPDPSAVPASAGATGAGEAHAAGGIAEPTQPPPPSGTPLAGASSGGGSGGAWGSGDATRPAWQVDTPVPTSGSSVRTGLIIAAVVGVAVLGVVALLVIGVVRTGSVTFSYDDGVFDGGDEFLDAGGEWDGESVDGGRIAVGETVSARVPSNGTYEVTVAIEDAGSYLIDARAGGAFDGMLEIRDPSGDLLGENDDRGEEFVDRVGGEWLDPLLEFDLDPGDYRVIVRGFAGDGGPFDLVVEPS